MPSPNSDGCFDNSQPFSFSHIEQLDGNVSINSGIKINRTVAALSLPIIATYNLRSMFPKINSLKTDIIFIWRLYGQLIATIQNRGCVYSRINGMIH